MNDLAKLLIHALLGLMSRGLLSAFVFALSAPILLCLLAVYNSGHEKIFYVLVNLLLFPAYLQGKEEMHLPDLVLAFIAWSLIFSAIAAIYRLVAKRKFPVAGNKILHRTYLAVYLISLVVVPFMPLDMDTRTSDMYIVLFVFFLIGYVALGFLILMRKFQELADKSLA